MGPYKRNRPAVNGFGEQPSHQSIRKSSSPKLKISFLDQVILLEALNRRLILPTWRRSSCRLVFSKMLLYVGWFASSPSVAPAAGTFGNLRSAGSWLTGASLASSSSATVKLDQPVASHGNEAKERLRVERAFTVEVRSFDPPPTETRAGSA